MRLGDIEQELEKLHAFHQLRTTPQMATRYGELLTQAKKLVKHGEWIPWLKMRGIKPRTARVWMQIATVLKSAPTAEFDCNSIAGILSLVSKGHEAEIDARRAEIAKLDTGSTPDDIHLIHDDFRELAHVVPEESAHLVVIDPPYKEHDFYVEASQLASSLLVDGGLALVYLANIDIGRIINLIEPHLRFYQCFGVFHACNGNARKGNFIPKWQPILVFQKGKKQLHTSAVDAFLSDGPNTTKHHLWQQDAGALKHWISRLTFPRQTVVDFFCGGGTTPLVCQETSRICYSADTDISSIKSVRALLSKYDLSST